MGFVKSKKNNMKKYIGTETIMATLMHVGDYYTKLGLTIPKEEDPKREGYLIIKPNEEGEFLLANNDFLTWSSKKDFEETHYEGMTVTVKAKCNSKKESRNYEPSRPISTAIELMVPYDQNSVFYQLSGGTSMILNTVNQEAADMFKLGEEYDIKISPSIPV